MTHSLIKYSTKIPSALIVLLLFSINGFAQDSTSKEADTTKVFKVQTVAKFKGGEKAMYQFISKELEYPPEALENGISGRVIVQFIVEKDGTTSGVRIRSKKRLGHGCEEAAIKVVKKMSGQWEPATQDGVPVRMRFVLPFRFQAETTPTPEKKKKKRRWN